MLPSSVRRSTVQVTSSIEIGAANIMCLEPLLSGVSDTQLNLTAEIASLCMVLFDRWCEKRSVVPLAYLMHTWPIVEPTLPLIGRLSSTLRELVIFHVDALDVEDHQMIRDVIEMANKLS